nr:trypsin-like peptidase domain-containing protein [Halobacterium jilantaiense]
MPSRRDVLRLGAGALAAGVAGCSGAPTNQETTVATTDGTTTGDPSTTRSGDVSPYTRVYRESIDSVVLVRTDSGQGTGWVYDDAVVVTNEHVVGPAEEVDVRFNDGEWRAGTVLGTDAHSDLAAIRVADRPADATPLPLADAAPVVGQEVVAIGNPFALSGSATTGVVSGTDRAIPAPTGYRIPDAVQTDAAVNPGNSGGPLMSLDSEVVAVINSGGGDNIAFGISAALTERVVPGLVADGDYQHAYIGLSFTAVTPAVAEANDLDEARGLLVVSVDPTGPSAGVMQGSDGTAFVDGRQVRTGGDVVLSVDGTTVQTFEDLLSLLALQTSPGDTATVAYLRDGERRTADIELGVRSET